MRDMINTVSLVRRCALTGKEILSCIILDTSIFIAGSMEDAQMRQKAGRVGPRLPANAFADDFLKSSLWSEKAP
jgi:hypothetical protein